MDSGPDSNEKPKRKRGRPPGKQNGMIDQERQERRENEPVKPLPKLQNATPAPLPLESSSPDDELADTTGAHPFSVFLQSIINQDRTEIERVAKELNVTENTIHRWMNGISVPRAAYLKRLPDLFPQQRAQLTQLIKQVFGDAASTLTPTLRELPKETYIKILELAANSEDEERRMWQVSQAIFEYALLHMDADHRGLMVIYARLMPPHSDGIHSLYEINRRCSNPSLFPIEAAAFLGSTSLAGRAAMMQCLQVSHHTNNDRTLIEIDEFAQSSCAVPVQRNGLLAGVLLFSSTQPDLFKNPLACQMATELALLMAVAVSDKDFYSPSRLNLRPMPDLAWQRTRLVETYLNRVIMYARRHAIARHEAELHIQHEMELEFEEAARRSSEQHQKEIPEVQAMPQQPPNTSSPR